MFFAPFFLRSLLSKELHLYDLSIMDMELYKNLLQVLEYKGNVEDLYLTFSLVDEMNRNIDLVRCLKIKVETEW